MTSKKDEIEAYIGKYKELLNLLLSFIDNDDDDGSSDDIKNLIKFTEKHNINEDTEMITYLLIFLNNISSNHRCGYDFFPKIIKIIIHYIDIIRKNLSDEEMLKIFALNYKVIYSLIEKEIIPINNDNFLLFYKGKNKRGIKQKYYLYQLIKSKIGKKKRDKIEYEISKIFKGSIDDFNAKCRISENDTYICSLIRNDSVEEFIAYTNQSGIPFDSYIKFSIFEMNSFLMNREPTLIEYAAFFGSIQIIRYLVLNNVYLHETIWLYAVHSNNAELIHYLEELKILPSTFYVRDIYKESIKCYHNGIASYIEDNYLSKAYDSDCYRYDKSILKRDFEKNTFNYIFGSYNFELFPEKFDIKFISLYLCKYKYTNLVKLLIETNELDLNVSIKEITPLKLAFDADNLELVNILLKSPDIRLKDEKFSKLRNFTSVTIPCCNNAIQDNLFMECKSLKQVTIPSSVTVIGLNAFKDCISLEKIIIPPSVEDIGCNAFSGCKSLKRIEIPNGITKISDGLFELCESLTEVKVPASLKSIGEHAFCGCKSLCKFEIPPEVTVIGKNAFSNCSSLTHIEIPSSIIEIGNEAFKGCTSLKEVTRSMKIFDKDTFIGCSSLENISVHLETILDGAFRECNSLKHLDIQSANFTASTEIKKNDLPDDSK